MDYSKLINDNGFYLYKDDSFNTIFLQIVFKREKGNFEDAVFDLLCIYLSRTNKNYSTEYELNKKITDLYSMDTGFNSYKIGSQLLFFFSADLVSPTVVHDDYSKDAFKFINEVLFEPDFTKEEVFKNVKEVYLSNRINNLSQPSIMARNLYERSTFNLDYEKYRYSTDEEYIKNMIDNITLKDLEELYKKTVNENNFVRGLVFGNINDSEFKTLRENINYKNNNNLLDYSIDYNLEDKDVEISSDNTSESTVYITYTMDNLDPGVGKIINDILNGSCDLCMEILREKYGLVYSSGANISYTGSYLVVRAKIDKNNKQKLIDAVDEMIKIIQDKDKLKSLLKSAKESIKNEYYLLSEDRNSMIYKIDDYVSGIFKDFDDTKFVQEIDKVDVDKVISYTKSLKRKNIFMYRGDLNE